MDYPIWNCWGKRVNMSDPLKGSHSYPEIIKGRGKQSKTKKNGLYKILRQWKEKAELGNNDQIRQKEKKYK